MNIILDLDETLVHVVTEPKPNHKYDFKFNIGGQMYYGIKRPYLNEYLAFLFRKFNSVGVWTAAVEEYAIKVVRAIFSQEQRRRLSLLNHRGHLSWSVFGGFTKSLSTVYGQKPKFNNRNTIIVDDRHISMKNNYGNAVIIKRFEGSPRDNELAKLMILFRGLLKFKNQINLSKHKNSMFVSQLTK